ncbi:GntR family transcriptional repressor for pyruvate dehydrogenase complex [Microbacterium sp. SORGH_AS 1204]|uniref:FadR/GntR family transcriptional regulator n=1 Tax=Microbacterium sp. SORGH_AS_1204 TaxID=3041785 RepID=UPI0027935E17|nr:GntR family transcriptional regulator [Microbacterium sp. SORGH_AS_1204]MDQ1138544.1 GntR family transcriptional repressor for pyruvate dehydrogenase complex [Microbacterium sp. SORGH_AS_1204]
MAFTPVQKVSAYEGIVEQIEAAVDSGQLQPGDRLPGERRLMEDFSVSRATVREALRVLQATGVVESRPGDPRGPVIAAFTPRLLEKSLGQLSRSATSRTELLQFRLFLEGTASFLAAQHHTDEQMAHIDENSQRLHDCVESGDVTQYPGLVRAFHDTIRAAAHNSLIAVCGSVVSETMTDLMGGRIASHREPTALLRRSAADGTKLVNIIRARDAHAARQASVESIYRFYEADLTVAEREAVRAAF